VLLHSPRQPLRFGGQLARRSVSFDGALYIIERDHGSAGSVMVSRPLPITQPVRNMPSGR
jgi:hypothetical protein